MPFLASFRESDFKVPVDNYPEPNLVIAGNSDQSITLFEVETTTPELHPVEKSYDGIISVGNFVTRQLFHRPNKS